MIIFFKNMRFPFFYLFAANAFIIALTFSRIVRSMRRSSSPASGSISSFPRSQSLRSSTNEPHPLELMLNNGSYDQKASLEGLTHSPLNHGRKSDADNVAIILAL